MEFGYFNRREFSDWALVQDLAKTHPVHPKILQILIQTFLTLPDCLADEGRERP